MHELVYVLTVEAFCFRLLGVILIAQTFDVFDLGANKVWPVLSTSLFFILVYVLVLLLTCCAISVGKFGVLGPSPVLVYWLARGRMRHELLIKHAPI